MTYCEEYILSSCGKKICCYVCEQGNCQERCHNPEVDCASKTTNKPTYEEDLLKGESHEKV